MESIMKENIVIREALQILENRLRRDSYTSFVGVQDTKNFLVLKLAGKKHEVFSALFLDNKHRLIQFSEIFRGTIDGCSVHPREVVRLSLQCNAAAVIFAHNHPSGVAEPSQADVRITDKLKQSLDLIDVRMLDHYVIGGTEVVSFAERGFL